MQTEVRREHFGAGNAYVWQSAVTSNGAIAFDSTIHKLSGYSMKVTISAAGGRAYLRNDMGAANMDSYFAGLWFYVPTATYNTIDAETDGDYLSMFVGEDTGFSAQVQVAIGNSGGTPVVFFTPNDGTTYSETTFPTRDAWHLVEWYWKKGASSTGAYQWWLDGASIASSASVSNSANALGRLNLGTRYSAGMTTSDGYYLGGFAIDSSKRITLGNRLLDRQLKRHGRLYL